MRVLIILLLPLITFSPIQLYSQEGWTLQSCIDTAIANNSNTRLAQLDISIANTTLNGEKYNFLPVINANATHGYNWGQTIDPFTNQFASSRVQYNNNYLSSSVTLFSGLTQFYNTKISIIDADIATAEGEFQKRNITVDILRAFLQVKLNEAIFSIRVKHLEYTNEELKKLKILEELEYETSSKRLELEARYAQENYQLILSNNDLQKSSFLLQTLMGKIPNRNFVLSDSLALHGNFENDETIVEELNLERNVLMQKQAKGQFAPTISLSGSLGSGYSENSTFVTVNGDLMPKPFGNQFNDNFYQSLSASLHIPIFNGSKTYSQIKISEFEYEQILIAKEQKKLDLMNRQLNLSLEIENRKSASKAAFKSYESFKQLYLNGQIRYENDVIGYFTFIQLKDSYLIAESELVQAKYRLTLAELVYFIYR